ncbi:MULTISPECIES: hypothetical protein [unclassified Mesorhizobium]|uniref:hypothetical protein n=1 Tax=unclassified Mesorhizobium TaxID=325217 RepID=UPI00333777E0
MLARLFPTERTETTAADRLRESLQLPAKPNILKLAEAGVDRIRTQRADRLNEIQAFASGTSTNKAHAAQLRVELEAFDQGDGKKAFEERSRRREAFGKAAMAELGPAVAEYRQEINQMIDEMEALNALVLELLAASNANGIEAITGIRASLPLSHVIRRLRQIINNNGSMF